MPCGMFANPALLHAVVERWLGKFEKRRLAALSELKRVLEGFRQGWSHIFSYLKTYMESGKSLPSWSYDRAHTPDAY